MAISIAVVCEAPADQRTGCDLADRIVCDDVSWIEEDSLPHLREWQGFPPRVSGLFEYLAEVADRLVSLF